MIARSSSISSIKKKIMNVKYRIESTYKKKTGCGFKPAVMPQFRSKGGASLISGSEYKSPRMIIIVKMKLEIETTDTTLDEINRWATLYLCGARLFFFFFYATGRRQLQLAR